MFWLKDTKTYTSFLKFCSDQARQGLNSYYSVQPVNTQTTLHLGKEAHDVWVQVSTKLKHSTSFSQTIQKAPQLLLAAENTQATLVH